MELEYLPSAVLIGVSVSQVYLACNERTLGKCSLFLIAEGRLDYSPVESTGISEPLPATEPRLGRRTVLTFPLLPPPQKN